MTKDELVKLAARCEAASGPDGELDREIAISVGHPRDYAADWGLRGHERPTAFPYTASIDAAMTLVGKDCLFHIKTLWANDQSGKACRASVDRYLTEGAIMWKENFLALADTPALALCAASLRATTTGEAK